MGGLTLFLGSMLNKSALGGGHHNYLKALVRIIFWPLKISAFAGMERIFSKSSSKVFFEENYPV